MRFAENPRLHTSKVLRLPRKMTSEVSNLPLKMQPIFWKCSKSIAPATQNDFWHVMKHVGMPRSATPATQNDMTTASDTSKKSRFCDYSHRHGHTALTRTVADSCGRLRTVADGWERLPCYAFGKKVIFHIIRWIGLRELLQECLIFRRKDHGFRWRCSLKIAMDSNNQWEQ